MRKGLSGKLAVSLLVAASLALVAAVSPATAGAAKCFGKRATEVGTGAGEKLRGTAHKDVLVTKGGADKALGKGGNDRICTGKGNDKANGGKGSDKINGGKGKDKLKGAKGNDFIDGGKGKDTAVGGPGTDTCVNVEVVKSCENQDPALHFSDQVDWGFTQDVNETDIGFDPGDTQQVNTSLRVGNGIAGAAGYARSNVSPEGFLGGTSQTLTFLENGAPDTDDANAVVSPPFPIPFFGVNYSQVVVSTNGFISFGDPAQDYYTDWNPTAAEMGEFHRGVFPLWSDLDLVEDSSPGDLPGVVTMVTTSDAVAFEFKDISFHAGGTPSGTPERNFQVVFFNDGRIRFDYPGSNAPSSTSDQFELVALSGGTGAGSYTEIQRDQNTVPSSSILFTPNSLGQTGAVPAGTATAPLPPGTTFVPGATDSRCSLSTAPTATTPGAVSCGSPVLNPGAQDAFNVAWTIPLTQPDLNFSATWSADSFNLTDAEQLPLNTHS